MSTRLALLLLASLPLLAQSPRVVSKDPRFDKVIPPGSKVEKVADGYAWVEGPVWDRKAGRLLFSDIPDNAVFAWLPGGITKLFLKPSGYTGPAPFTGREPGSNGLAIDAQGRLVLCEHGDRRIARLEAAGRKTTLADRYDGKRLNSPNDLVFHSNGDLYFTDPPFGLPKAFDDPGKELPFQGVYRVSAGGRLTLLTRDVRAPNGIAISPAGDVLYVSNADRSNPVWMAFDLRADGTLGPGRVLFDATGWVRAGKKGAPDGMKVDRHGNIFGAGPGGLHVLSPEGKHLGSIEMDAATSNCAWGEDGSVLYFTASTAIYRIKTATNGARF